MAEKVPHPHIDWKSISGSLSSELHFRTVYKAQTSKLTNHVQSTRERGFDSKGAGFPALPPAAHLERRDGGDGPRALERTCLPLYAHVDNGQPDRLATMLTQWTCKLHAGTRARRHGLTWDPGLSSTVARKLRAADAAAPSMDPVERRTPSMDPEERQAPSMGTEEHRTPSMDPEERRTPSMDPEERRTPLSSAGRC